MKDHDNLKLQLWNSNRATQPNDGWIRKIWATVAEAAEQA